jgi:hypothetical protein
MIARRRSLRTRCLIQSASLKTEVCGMHTQSHHAADFDRAQSLTESAVFVQNLESSAHVAHIAGQRCISCACGVSKAILRTAYVDVNASR